MVAGMLAAGCGGDGRPRTAPPLPVPILDAPCSEYDVGADGTVDIVYDFTYDRAGFMIRYVGTSSAMEVGEYTYDADHFVLRYTQDYAGDAQFEYEETYTRDPLGRPLTYHRRDANGTSSATYTYDAMGRLTRAVTTDDNDTTTTVDYVYTGNRLNPVSARAVYPGIASSITFTSSADERTLHADIDDGEDGTIDRTTDTVYDDERRVVEQTNRTGAMVTSRDVRVFNDNGHLTSRTYSDGESGPVDLEFYAQFDGRGMQT